MMTFLVIQTVEFAGFVGQVGNIEPKLAYDCQFVFSLKTLLEFIMDYVWMSCGL